MITVFRETIDNANEKREFKTLKGARAYAVRGVGPTPTLGSTYAVSDDGVVIIRVAGVTLKELFGLEEKLVLGSDEHIEMEYQARVKECDELAAKTLASGLEADQYEAYLAWELLIDDFGYRKYGKNSPIKPLYGPDEEIPF